MAASKFVLLKNLKFNSHGDLTMVVTCMNGHKTVHTLDTVDLTRYTCRDDKRKIEIYDGDIIKVEASKDDWVWPMHDKDRKDRIENGDVGEVYSAGGHCAVRFPGDQHIDLDSISNENFEMTCVVIGNIFENWKLLPWGKKRYSKMFNNSGK